MLMKKMKKDNRGFTIVELLVSLAIGAIIVAGIGSIMIVSSKSFASTSADAGLQSSAQIIMDHIQDVVIDANLRIEYSYTEEPGTSDALPYVGEDKWTDVLKDSDIPAASDAVTQKRLTIYNFNTNISSGDLSRNKRYEIIWVQKWKGAGNNISSEVWYTEQPIDNALNVYGTRETAKLADNVVSFGCDLSEIEKKRILYVVMDLERGSVAGEATNKRYHAENNISLRNKVAVSASLIPLSPSVNIATMPLNAEPGMTLPLAVRKVTTSGNATNKVYFELKDEDNSSIPNWADGHDDAVTRISDDKKSLIISPKERVDYIYVRAVSEFDSSVYDLVQVNINRVYWTTDMVSKNSAALGYSTNPDFGEGIIIQGEDEVSPGAVVRYTAEIKGHTDPSYSGADRFNQYFIEEPVVITAPAGKTVNPGSVSFNYTTGTLKLDTSVPAGTKIKIKFVSEHSLKRGLSVRTEDYPVADGIFREKTVTVKGFTNPYFPNANLVRGAASNWPMSKFLDEEWYKKEWDRISKYPGVSKMALFWRTYQTRPVLESGYTKYYPDDDGWSDPEYTDSPEEITRTDVVSSSGGWHFIEDGKDTNLEKDSFSCLSPNEDVKMQCMLVGVDDSQVILARSPHFTVKINGFRAIVSMQDDDFKNTRQLTTQYITDRTTGINSKDDHWGVFKLRQDGFSIGNMNEWLDWSKPNDNWMISTSPGGDDEDIDLDFNLKRADEVVEQVGDMYSVFTEMHITLRGGNNFTDKVIQKLKDKDSITLYLWPNFTYHYKKHVARTHYMGGPKTHHDSGTDSVKRKSNYFYWDMKKGNITVAGYEGFVPYPAINKADGTRVEKHPAFWGSFAQSNNYQSVGRHTIIVIDESNKLSDQKVRDKDCEMKYDSGSWYLRIKDVAYYKYDPTKERWEKIKNDGRTVNLQTNNLKVYLPEPGSSEFYTGFKNIEGQTDTFPKYASGIKMYYINGNQWQNLDQPIVLYYRSGGKYRVQIIKINQNRWTNKFFEYDEDIDYWDEVTDNNYPIINIKINASGDNYLYIPGPDDDVRWAKDYVYYYDFWGTKEWIKLKDPQDIKVKNYRRDSKIVIESFNYKGVGYANWHHVYDWDNKRWNKLWD